MAALKRMMPTNVTYCGPCGCERQPAHIYNATADVLDSGDLGLTAYRFLQNRSGLRRANFDTGLYTGTLVAGFALPGAAPLALRVAVVGLPSIIKVAIALSSRRRYHDAMQASATFLRASLGGVLFGQVERTNYHRQLSALLVYMQEAGIDHRALGEKIREKQQRKHPRNNAELPLISFVEQLDWTVNALLSGPAAPPEQEEMAQATTASLS
ncbi:MAG: hypothetical protein EOO77_09500 [Oxalobacteraceae bacterium]|nr:MAG: hypothetical protein EOO77_09500 [Oxalobacteraceae bacterium]